jgi:hypothetical protein
MHPLPALASNQQPPTARRARLAELRRQILEEQAKAQEPSNVFPAAFVTFRRNTSQVGVALSWRALLDEGQRAA